MDTSRQFIEDMTGYKVNKDYKNVKASFSAAIQSFQSCQIDVYTIGCLDPYAQLQQLHVTSKLRFWGTKNADEGYKKKELAGLFKLPGRTMGRIPKNIYGDNQKNEADVGANDAILGVTIRKGVDDETVYQMMKAFWSAIEKMQANAPWTRPVTIGYATQKLAMPFHPAPFFLRGNSKALANPSA